MAKKLDRVSLKVHRKRYAKEKRNVVNCRRNNAISFMIRHDNQEEIRVHKFMSSLDRFL